MKIRFSDEKGYGLGPEQPANNTVAQVATGVAKAVEGVINFPTVAFQYITGTTTHLGEIGPWSNFGQQFSGDYGDDPVNRAVNVVNHMGYGTLDLVLGHLPYQASMALGVQHYTPFFSPPPARLKGMQPISPTSASSLHFRRQGVRSR